MASTEPDPRADLTRQLLPLFGETHRLALNAWSLLTKVRETNWARDGLSEETRLAEATSLESLRREIVLGLCRLDEDDSSNWSFHTAKKLVSQGGFPQNFVDVVNDRVKNFRQKINPFKQEHRNAYIAHQSKNKFRNQFQLPITEFDPKLLECVILAFTVTDCLLGERIELGWQLPDSNNTMLNLREALEK